MSIPQALSWKNDCLEIVDQTQLPERTVHLQLRGIEEVFEAIQKLRVRGAPAIGIAAAYGLYLGVREMVFESPEQLFQTMTEKIRYLASARPTAVNLFWALEENKKKLLGLPSCTGVKQLKDWLLKLAMELHEDDRQRCERLAEHGLGLVPDQARILTHCNTGALATGGIGTALGIIYKAHSAGKQIQGYADETRPLLQGARLTMWELAQANIPAQLLCDGAAASLMQQRDVDLVIVGADRITADGSVANKIGTYHLAIAAKYHRIPFYVAAPLSTFDLSIGQGSQIPIEMRSEEEVRRVFNRCQITVPEARCWNPAFDVTPPDLVSAIITEAGIIYPPLKENIRKFIAAG